MPMMTYYEKELRVAVAVEPDKSGYEYDPDWPSVLFLNLYSQWLYLFLHDWELNDFRRRLCNVDLPEYTKVRTLAAAAADQLSVSYTSNDDAEEIVDLILASLAGA